MHACVQIIISTNFVDYISLMYPGSFCLKLKTREEEEEENGGGRRGEEEEQVHLIEIRSWLSRLLIYMLVGMHARRILFLSFSSSSFPFILEGWEEEKETCSFLNLQI